ncbi:MAG: ferrous iron transporter B [Acholeplasmatales bacterium]|nr:ferrous iron transporter B [Acholeplasmatales bacterium]
MAKTKFTFALAGNPNCGKSTLFNALTGANAYVGNWPGVTVDKKEGTYKKTPEPVSILDLPGIYSLSPYTPEEVIARDVILGTQSNGKGGFEEKPNVIINIVDATNLERNLYLTTQLIEMDVPVVVALNMMDLVEKNGNKIDKTVIEAKLGVPVVAISAQKGEGIEDLMTHAYNEASRERKGSTFLQEGPLGHLISDCKAAFTGLEVSHPLFHAIKLVENDEIETKAHPDLVKVVDEFKKEFNDEVFGDDLEAVVADARYSFISKNLSIAKTNAEGKEIKVEGKTKLTKSDKADKILTNKWAGIPIFLLILFLVFHLTFSGDFLFLGKLINFKEASFADSEYWAELFWTEDGINSPGVIIFNGFNSFFGWLAHFLTDAIDKTSWPDMLKGFLCDGCIEGVLAVLSFIPVILVLFLFFSILEDSGYMARVAFILDRIFRKFGLSGRAFMPMIMGFGCSIPAMINTRTLAEDRERTATIRVIPFFSCGAKLPILTACAGAVAEMADISNVDLITYSMYLIGMVIAIITVIVMRNTTMRGQVPPFIMELPQYHRPSFRATMIHLWDKTKHYVKKAFTIILVSTIVIWFLCHIDFSWHLIEDEEIDQSVIANIGNLFSPIFTPMGFGKQLNDGYEWVFVVGAVTGLIAKENVIATFATIAACIAAAISLDPEIAALVAEEDEVASVQAMVAATGISKAGIIAFIVFNLTTIPCFAAVATAKGELQQGKLGWTLLFWVVVSYVSGVVVYTTLEYVWPVALWIVAAVAAGFAIHFINKYLDNKKAMATA